MPAPRELLQRCEDFSSLRDRGRDPSDAHPEPEPLPAPTFAAHHAIYSELMRRHDRIRMREIPETEA